jgi:hypothetical protein
MAHSKWILQTFYFGNDQLEHHGFTREFATKEEAETYAQSNLCGGRHTITFYADPITKFLEVARQYVAEGIPEFDQALASAKEEWGWRQTICMFCGADMQTGPRCSSCGAL